MISRVLRISKSMAPVFQTNISGLVRFLHIRNISEMNRRMCKLFASVK